MAEPTRRARAARMSASGMGSRAGMAAASEFDGHSQALFQGLLVDVMRRRQVLHGQPQRLEQRDLVGRGPARDLAKQNFADLAPDVVVADGALLLGK